MRHNPKKDMIKSEKDSKLPFWKESYKAFFGPRFEDMTYNKNDLEAQKAGVDRIITLTEGTTVFVDEKLRYVDYPDILIEFRSSRENNTPGWIRKPLRIDYIAYAVVSEELVLRKFYMLPFNALQAAWRRHHKQWKKMYSEKQSPNTGYNGTVYHTINLAIPTEVLLSAIIESLIVKHPKSQTLKVQFSNEEMSKSEKKKGFNCFG